MFRIFPVCVPLRSFLDDAWQRNPYVRLISVDILCVALQRTFLFHIHNRESSPAIHVCLSTLHANNVDQALQGIINFFPDTAHHGLLLDLSQHLRAIISQRLIPTKDNKLAAAVEIMLISPFIAELIEEGRISEIKDAMEQAQVDGMQTFDQSLYELVKAGRIDVDQALRNADSKNNLRLRLRLEDPEHFASTEELSMKNEDTNPRIR